MSEISFVSTLLLFIMSSFPNLLWVAPAPSLPSSGKKLKLNFKKKGGGEESKERQKKKLMYSIQLTHRLFWYNKFFFCAIYYVTQIIEKINLPTVSKKKQQHYPL